MIVRILIALILLLSVLNMVGRPADSVIDYATKKQTASAQDQSPASLLPIIEILSALTVLLLSQNYLNRQLKKIKASAIRAKLGRRLFYPETRTANFPNSLQQG